MFKKSIFIPIICSLITISSAQVFVSDSAKVDSAKQSAESWLKLIDQEEYAESWEQTSSFFKSQVSQNQWVVTISNLKSSIGKTITRKLLLAKYTTSLPGAPSGEYVVIQFRTDFETKEGAIETITPMKDSDGMWRVSGYFIK